MPLHQTFPGYSQQPGQQQMAAVVYGINADLGFTVPLTVTTVADSDSAVMLVAGFNSFMCITNPTGGGGTYTISWVHVDPQTGIDLFVRPIQAGVSPAADAIFTFGAFGVTTATMGGDVFIQGKIRLRAAAANVTFNNIRLWAGKR